MILIRIEENLAIQTAKLVVVTNYFVPVQAVNQLLQTYLIGQKVTIPFIFSNIISIFLSIVVGYKFIIMDNYRELGFIYMRTVQEIFNLGFSIVVMYIYADKRSLLKPTFKMITKDFLPYIYYNIKTALAFYGECFSFELNTILAAALQDLVQLSSYFAIINTIIYVFFMSIGFANTFRTNLGIDLGRGLISKARSKSIIYMMYVGVVTLFCISVMEIFNKEIVFIYAGINETSSIVQTGIRVYYMCIFPTFMLYALSSVMRFVNYNELAVHVMVFLIPVMVLIASGFFAFYLDMKTIGLVYGFVISKWVAVLVFMKVIYSVDWEVNYEEFKKNNSKNIENLERNGSKEVSKHDEN
jgi:Na+-driven multidrug efflux pump